MRILFCLGGLNKGGAERVATNLCNFFVEKGHNVEILVTRLDSISYNLNPKIDIVSLEKEQNKSNVLKHNISLIKKMKKEILKYNPNIIISFLKEPTGRILFLKKYCKKIKNIPLIISVRNDPNVIYKSFLDKLVLKTLYNNANGYVFQTTVAKKFFSAKIQKKSTIIPNPIDKKFLQLPSENRNNIISTVGRLMPQKNHQFTIDSFKEILNKYPKYKLYIYGDGPLKDELDKYITENNLTQNVFLKGIVDDIKNEIYNSKMFIMSSKYEGMPNALMEAMAMGLPCISTRCSGGGAEFLIDNGKNGFLINNGDKNAMTETMIKIIENETLAAKIALGAHNKLMKFNPDIINKKWLDYIISIERNN